MFVVSDVPGVTVVRGVIVVSVVRVVIGVISSPCQSHTPPNQYHTINIKHNTQEK